MNITTSKVVLMVLSLGFAILLGCQSVKRQPLLSSEHEGIKRHIKIGFSNWTGYFPFCSPQMQKRMINEGYLVQCQYDKESYSQKFKDLKDGALDFTVSAIDGYLYSAQQYGYPGKIVAVTDESKGGDAIIARADKVSNIDDLRKEDIRIAVISQTPSEFLLKTIAVHFDIQHLLNSNAWKVEASSSPDALAKLQSGEADAAIVWQPDLTFGLADSRLKNIFSTKDLSQLLVDVIIANQTFTEEQPDVVELFLANFFQTLESYSNHPSELIHDIEDKTGFQPADIASILDGIVWHNISTNARQWYGITADGSESLTHAIDEIIHIHEIAGGMSSDLQINVNPYMIQNRTFIEKLYNTNVHETDDTSFDEPSFEALSTIEWQALTEVGTLKVRPIEFNSGGSQLTVKGMEEVTKAFDSLQHFPNFRVAIEVHSGLNGDKTANQQLSQRRADAVKNYLIDTFNVDKNRLRAMGLDASKPLSEKPGEFDNDYNDRLPRVELRMLSKM